MDSAPGNWVLSPEGELIHIWHALADGELFADYVVTVHQIIPPDDEKHAHLLRAHFSDEEEPTDYLLAASDRVTPDGYIIMQIVLPPGV